MPGFPDDLESCAAAIEAALGGLLTPAGLAGLASPGRPPDRLIAAMRHGALGGGKRLRPLLVRQTAGVFGIAPEAALPAGLAVELVHCYSLIHDDLPAMDDDDLRRGRPTVHKAFDEATAILAGDALLTQAFAILSTPDCHPDPAIRNLLVAELALGAGPGGMVGGQMRDIEGEASPLGADGIELMQSMKTGALIRAAIRMGALLGRASDDALGPLTRFAEHAGRAFQLADDLLDATSTAEALGKAAGKDEAAGKQTLVARLGLPAARRRLGDLVHDALTELLPFGPEADGLRDTARYFATREK
jgi:farnesyl diphosphate synthase